MPINTMQTTSPYPQTAQPNGNIASQKPKMAPKTPPGAEKKNISSEKNTSQKQEKDTNIKDSAEQKNKSDNTKKILVGAGLALAALAGIYAGGRKGLFGQSFQNLLTRNAERAGNAAAGEAQRGCGAIDEAIDKLDYNVKPAKIDDISLPDDFTTNEIYAYRWYDEDFPLQSEYWKISQDIQRDANTTRRYNEVAESLEETANKIDTELKKYKDEIVRGNIDYKAKEWAQDLGTNFGINTERAITQKRYFSLPNNQSEGYSGKDPLLYKEAREEIADTYLGYTLLVPIQGQNKKRQGSPVINVLRREHPITNSEDNKFIDECVLRMTSNNDARCHGHGSVFHANELARLGKIFREAMGIEVK